MDNEPFDVEQELCNLLQEEIWKEITASTGVTKEDLDNEIIAAIRQLQQEDKENGR